MVAKIQVDYLKTHYSAKILMEVLHLSVWEEASQEETFRKSEPRTHTKKVQMNQFVSLGNCPLETGRKEEELLAAKRVPPARE